MGGRGWLEVQVCRECGSLAASVVWVGSGVRVGGVEAVMWGRVG